MSPEDEAMIARMKADLGNSRREAVSTFRVDHRGQSIRGDERAQIAGSGRVRELHDTYVAGLQGDGASRIQAWAAKSREAEDTSGLTDLYAGQGHRVNTARLHQTDDDFERDVAKFGLERAQHLFERRNQRLATAPSRQPHGGSSQHRAPSPSAGGVVRYVNGKLVSSSGKPITSKPQLTTSSEAQIKQKLAAVDLYKHGSSVKVQQTTVQPNASARVGKSHAHSVASRTRASGHQEQAVEDIPYTNSWQKFAKAESTPITRQPNACKPVAPTSATATRVMIKPALSEAASLQPAEAQHKPPLAETVDVRAGYLKLKDIVEAAPDVRLSEIYAVLDKLFEPARRNFLLANPHLIEATMKLGIMLREEMMVAASMGDASMCWKSFLEEFGFVADIRKHLAVAVRALQYAQHKHPVDEAFFAAHDQYQPFRNMAVRMLQPAPTTAVAMSQVNTIPVSASQESTGNASSDQSQNYTLKAQSSKIKDDHDGGPRSSAEEPRTQIAMEPDVMALLRKTTRIMLSRAGMMPDGVYKRNGVYFINPN